MAVFYVNMILKGTITIEDVPTSYRAETEQVMEYFNQVKAGTLAIEDVPTKYQIGIKNLMVLFGNK